MTVESAPKDERMLSLLLFLDARSTPATLEEIESNVEGYTGISLHDESALKLLKRDIASLSEMSIFIDKAEDERYSLDRKGTYTADLALDRDESALLAVASATSLEDPDFPLRDELRHAYLKLTTSSPTPLEGPPPQVPSASSAIPRSSQDAIRKISRGMAARKFLTFEYTKPDGSRSSRLVEPYLLFSISGVLYLGAWDINASGNRQFRLDRMSSVKQRSSSSAPDFEPRGLVIDDFLDFPFAFGNDDPFDVVFLIPKNSPRVPERLWERRAVVFPVAGQAEYELMLASARSVEKAAEWAVEHSVDTIPVSPPEVVEAFERGLVDCEVAHGSNR